MMRQSPEIRYDVATAISQGRRDYQEDAIITDFMLGSDLGFVVLADGMGGHSAGDVASKIVVTEVFSELKIQSGDQAAFEKNLPSILLDAATAANECVHAHMKVNPETNGMGSTLVAPVFVRDNLYWISVGDSPLFLFRTDALTQINEDHSMAPHIENMVNSGLMAHEDGLNHPDRNCLTSVLIGGDIARVDCPSEPLKLQDGDVLVVASDGLQFLSNIEIQDILRENRAKSSADIAKILLCNLNDLGDPDQDNISFSVIKVSDAKSDQAPASHAQEVPFSTHRSDSDRATDGASRHKPLRLVRGATYGQDNIQ